MAAVSLLVLLIAVTFVLAAQREEWPERASEHWDGYQAYLRERQGVFPPGAYALATSEWYFDARDHRCPHDAWLESATLRESVSGPQIQDRSLSLHVTLLGAYHDLWIDLTYTDVRSYELGVVDGAGGHRDWRYDEFRLSDTGGVVHEIEWWHLHATGRWIIEAGDVQFTTRVRSSEPTS